MIIDMSNKVYVHVELGVWPINTSAAAFTAFNQQQHQQNCQKMNLDNMTTTVTMMPSQQSQSTKTMTTITTPQQPPYTFTLHSLQFQCGATVPQANFVYQTYGKHNTDKSNIQSTGQPVQTTWPIWPVKWIGLVQWFGIVQPNHPAWLIHPVWCNSNWTICRDPIVLCQTSASDFPARTCCWNCQRNFPTSLLISVKLRNESNLLTRFTYV